MQPVISGGFQFMRRGDFSLSVSYLQISIWVVTIVLMIIFTQVIGRTAPGYAWYVWKDGKYD